MRITNKDLESVIARINKATNQPETPWKRVEGRNVAQIGNYHLSQAYGGVCLHQMASEGGGVHDTFRCGHVPKKDLYNRMQAFLDGMEV